jgi:hypothetical protein
MVEEADRGGGRKVQEPTRMGRAGKKESSWWQKVVEKTSAYWRLPYKIYVEVDARGSDLFSLFLLGHKLAVCQGLVFSFSKHFQFCQLGLVVFQLRLFSWT